MNNDTSSQKIVENADRNEAEPTQATSQKAVAQQDIAPSNDTNRSSIVLNGSSTIQQKQPAQPQESTKAAPARAPQPRQSNDSTQPHQPTHQINPSENESNTLHRNSHNSSSMNDISEWVAKKNLQQSEKQIDLVLNRINLLKKEEERTAKRIEETKRKTDKVIEQKRHNQEMNQIKHNSRQNDGDYLKLLQRKSYESRRQQEEEREQIRNALLEMKKEERNQIQRLRELNNKRIEEYRSQHLNANREKYNIVRTSKQESKANIDKYWTNHLQNIAKEHNDRKNSHIQTKNQRDLFLQRLEKQELELIHRLEQSQNNHYDAQRELEEVQQMPNQEITERYPNLQNTSTLKQSQSSRNYNNHTINNSSTFSRHNLTQSQPI